MSKSGIVMFCNDNEFQIQMLAHCLESIRYYGPDIPITLFHDGINILQLQEWASQYRIYPNELQAQDPYVNKYVSLTKTPYSKTLYVDNDVLCTQPIASLIEAEPLLIMRKNDEYDISILQKAGINNQLTSSFDTFPWYNTGVIVYDSSFVTILLKYLSYTEAIPKLRHFDQSLISFIITIEQVRNSSSWTNRELQLVLCDTYIKPQYPAMQKILEKRRIEVDMNYTSNTELFFSNDFKLLLQNFYFVHYNLGNPMTTHLKRDFFNQIIQADLFHKFIIT